MSLDFANGTREALVTYFFTALEEEIRTNEDITEDKDSCVARVCGKYKQAISTLTDEKMLRSALKNLDNIPLNLVVEQAETSSIEELVEVIRLTSEDFDFD